MFHQTRLKTVAGLVTLAGLVLYAVFGGFYDREIVIDIALLAMLAISLDMVAGYGGMISLCHGALFGLGAYGYAVMAAMVQAPTGVAMLAGIAAAALVGLLVGAVAARTAGIFFIMLTLAFGQMLYVLVFSSPGLGGDDGMAAGQRLDLAWIGLDSGDSLVFALLCLAGLGLIYGLAAVLLRAAFGRTLCGIHGNETRMRAIGVTVWGHKAVAFAVSAALAGAAGTLAAQHTQYVSPLLLIWTMSGEALVVVILGGIGTLIGPVIGATALVLFKHKGLEAVEAAINAAAGRRAVELTDYWHLWVGAALVLTVIAGGRGLYGSIEHRAGRRRDATPAAGTPSPGPSPGPSSGPSPGASAGPSAGPSASRPAVAGLERADA